MSSTSAVLNTLTTPTTSICHKDTCIVQAPRAIVQHACPVQLHLIDHGRHVGCNTEQVVYITSCACEGTYPVYRHGLQAINLEGCCVPHKRDAGARSSACLTAKATVAVHAGYGVLSGDRESHRSAVAGTFEHGAHHGDDYQAPGRACDAHDYMLLRDVVSTCKPGEHPLSSVQSSVSVCATTFRNRCLQHLVSLY